jgi:hypothetical protein
MRRREGRGCLSRSVPGGLALVGFKLRLLLLCRVLTRRRRLIDQHSLAVLYALLGQCQPCAGHVEQEKLGFRINTLIGNLETFPRMYPVRLYLSVTRHVLIPAFNATRAKTPSRNAA